MKAKTIEEAYHLPRNPLRRKGKPGEFKPSKEWKEKFPDEDAEEVNEGFATHEGRQLNRIAGWLGYDDLEEMLGDNPGLFEVCVEWIDNTFGEQLAQEIDPESLEAVGLYNAAEESRNSDDYLEDDEEDKGLKWGNN